MSDFFSLWTPVGLAQLRASMVGGPALDITHLAVGDGNGSPIDPTSAITLAREVYRGAATVVLDPDKANQIMVQMTVPKNIGGFTGRELLAIDKNGNGVAIGSIAPTPKVAIESGSPNEFVLRMYLTITATTNVVLAIDPSAIGATQAYVVSSMAQHVAASDPHPVYLLKTDAALLYAGKVHPHVIADTAGLQAALDAKLDVSMYQTHWMPLDQILFFGSFA